MADAYRFGIEEEYFLCDASTGCSPSSEATDRFHAAAKDAVQPVSHELLKGQVEVCTKPGTDVEVARTALSTMRRTLSAIAGECGLLLFAAGSHPLAEAKAQSTTQSERYQKLEAEFGIIATRSMVCAMHIHVEVPDPGRRVDLMNRLTPFLPLLLALSVSSPFWQRRRSGLHGFRLAAFSEWPRMGLPDLFEGEADYARFVALLVDAGAIENASFIWWLIRPSTHYPTLELRICDSCSDMADTMAIASLYRCLVRAAVRRPDLNAGYGPIDRGICAENIWHAQRDGLGARFIDASDGTVSTVAESLEAALSLVADDAEALGCKEPVAATREILRRGTSADRQLAAFDAARQRGEGEAEALCSVIRMLATTTAP